MLCPMLTRNSFKLVAIKLVTPGKEHLEKHYDDLSSKPFFAGLVSCTLHCTRVLASITYMIEQT
jgi:nucleoside diphosphate kinase